MKNLARSLKLHQCINRMNQSSRQKCKSTSKCLNAGFFEVVIVFSFFSLNKSNTDIAFCLDKSNVYKKKSTVNKYWSHNQFLLITELKRKKNNCNKWLNFSCSLSLVAVCIKFSNIWLGLRKLIPAGENEDIFRCFS